MTMAIPCCDVLSSLTGQHAQRGQHATICAKHAALGWVDTYRGLDSIQTRDCGCVSTVLYQVSLSKCRTHTVGPLACCQLANRKYCVCAYAYDCIVHGERHHGTHD